MPAGRKAFLSRQHLTYGNTVLPKQFIITVYQLSLSHCRKKLPLVHTVQFPQGSQLASSWSHRSGRYQHDFHSCFMQLGHLVHQCRHAGYIQCAVTAGQHVTTYLYRDSFILIRFVFHDSLSLLHRKHLKNLSNTHYLIIFSGKCNKYHTETKQFITII